MDGEPRQDGAGPHPAEVEEVLTATTAEEAMAQRSAGDEDPDEAGEAVAEQAYAPQPAAVGGADHLDEDLAEQLRRRRDRDVRDA